MATDLTPRLGHYCYMEMVVELIQESDQLKVRWPGIPAEFAVVLEPTDRPGQFLLRGGPAHGAPATYVPGDGETPEHIKVMGFVLKPCAPPSAEQLAGARRHLAPAMSADAARDSAFQELWQQTLAGPAGAEIDYDLAYPKHEFLRYLEGLDSVIFHGSGDFAIEEFRPLRTSMELNDPTGRGNRLAVYGTHDALWPLFFAVIDRPRLNGSIRNGVDYFQNQQGEQLAGYHFSINKEQVADRPYRTGMLYILPRDPFIRLEHGPGILANEWACEQNVRPLAKLRVEPADFPFLEQIAGHDDAAFIHSDELAKQFLSHVTSASVRGETIVMSLAWSEAVAAITIPFIEAQRQILPAGQFTLTFPPGPEPITLTIAGPPAYLAVVKQRLGDRLQHDSA